MSDKRFAIIFDGLLRPGVESTTARLNLAELFKTDVESIERLFTGRPVAVKHDLSHADAQTYLLALNNAGVEARIEAQQSAAFSLNEIQETAASDANASPYAPPRAAVGESLPEFSTLKVFTLRGRIGRLRLLAWTMVLTLVVFAISGVLITVGLGVAAVSPTAATVLGVLLGIALVIAFFWINIQISVQRLHDLGWSGWLWFLHLVPFVGSIFPFLLLVLPGNTGANQYGPPPPRNSTAVKVLATLWLAFLPLLLVGGIILGMNGYLDRFENSVDSHYENSSLNYEQEGDDTTVVEEVDVHSADDTAEPVDSAQE